MKRLFLALLLVSSFVIRHSSFAADAPLRIFIRSGPKSHGPGAHDYPQFLKDWVPLLIERGAKAAGKDGFPSKEEFDNTDVLILHAQEAGNISVGEERKNLLEFLKRGGGLVVIHAGAVSRDPEWFKTIAGGSWNHKTPTKWLEAPMSLYFTDRDNPITRDIGNFDIDDEIYYDMDILPESKILAAAYTPKARDTGGKGNREAQQRAAEAVAKGKAVNIYDIQPQMWSYEGVATDEGVKPLASLPGIGGNYYRSFVCIPGHYYANFSHNGLRTALLRGIAWAGKRENADLLCKPDELGDALRYVDGGTPRPQDMPKHLEVHPDFDISLVAAEPLINKPMNVDWDAKGRLWVCETPEYPNGLREPKPEIAPGDVWKDSGSATPGKYNRDPIDRISILTDTNGDGVMDKKHVFADKLELVTSFCFHKNGVIACAAPDIWYLEDTNGDDTADKRSKIYTGLGTGDTHAVINNMRWGMDGWVYATHGYSAGHVTSPDGKKDFGVDGAGVVRFKPDGSAFEQYASRGGNTWGLDITWDGRVFYTQPTSGNHFIQVILPEYILAKGKLPGVMGTNGMLPKEPSFPAMHWEQQAYVQIDVVGSYTAAAGCAIYEGGAWPAKWNNGYFTTEPTINIVSHFMVEPDSATNGATHKAHREPGREQTEFIRSKNLWFRPIEVRVGPDGALYVVDFCNQAVIHNDTRGPVHGPANAAVRPDRDHYYGRIWKVQHKQAAKLAPVSLDKTNLQQLHDTVKGNPNATTRQTAWRLMAERLGANKEDSFRPTLTSGAPRFSVQVDPKDRISNKPYVSVVAVNPADLKGMPGKAGEYAVIISSDQPVTTSNLPDAMRDSLIKQLNEGPEWVPARYYSLESATGSPELRAALMSRYARSTNDWGRSAIIATLSGHAGAVIKEALSAAEGADKLSGLVSALLPTALPSDIAQLVESCAAAPSSSNALKAIVLQGMAEQTGISLTQNSALKEPLQKLLANPATAPVALPLAARWDGDRVLGKERDAVVQTLMARMKDVQAPVQARLDAARGFLGSSGGSASKDLIAEAAMEIDRKADPAKPEFINPRELRFGMVKLIAERTEPYVAARLMDTYVDVEPELQAVIFEELLKRPEWAQEILSEVERGVVKPSDIGPSNVARLRTHPNKQVAARANRMLEKLSPSTVAKNQIIAQLTAEVEKPGDVAKGKVLYGACAICHKLGDLGQPVGPPLDGMGAHGPAELLVHIVDPNREVDPSFWANNITTKKGEIFVGVVTSENASTLTLATQLGVKEIAKSDIATRENTRRSLMPEGLEGLGAETLRDILAYICGDALKHFRIVDLKPAYTADSREGVFAGSRPNQGQVRLAKYGNVSVNGIPFFIQDASKSASASNLIVLKGGPEKSQSWTYPQKVEVAVNAAAKKLHLLSGIAGWGWPAVRDKIPALKATVTYASGEKEEIVMKNGVEFADYIRPVEVPGSEFVETVTDGQQARLVTLTLTKAGVIKTLALESFANGIAPVVIAVTADVEGKLGAKGSAGTPARNQADTASEPGPKEGGKGDGPLAPAAPVSWEAGKTKVLLIGGGSSHDFATFFGGTDSATLKAAGFSVHYTEDRDQAASELAKADVAVISVNRKFFDIPAYRKALFDFAAEGKGIIMLHPGTWYGFVGWPELNAQIVGGGARGHDKIHPFDVKALKPDHPVMQGVPASFTVEDELYYVNAEPDKTPAGTAPIEVLAETSPSDKFQKPHPSVWITKHDKARIVGIALGHDARTHDLEPYKKLLSNAVKWASGK
jgi:putative membrane-bound dehydrogenase-like protein